MHPKTILVHVAPGYGDAAHIRVAADIARLFDAELVGLGAEAFDPARDRDLTHLDGLQVAAIRARIDTELEAAKAAFVGLAHGLRTDWRSAYEDPDQLLVAHAARADLIVAAAVPTARRKSRTVASTEDLLLDSGLPVLVVPPGQTTFRPDRVLIGWKNSREARRAVGDALPFLRLAQTVRILAVREHQEDSVEADLGNVALRLSRHGVDVEVELVEGSRTSAAEVLIQSAHAHRDDLVVAGAYGHSRLREWVLGGVTRHLLAHAGKPVLFGR